MYYMRNYSDITAISTLSLLCCTPEACGCLLAEAVHAVRVPRGYRCRLRCALHDRTAQMYRHV